MARRSQIGIWCSVQSRVLCPSLRVSRVQGRWVSFWSLGSGMYHGESSDILQATGIVLWSQHATKPQKVKGGKLKREVYWEFVVLHETFIRRGAAPQLAKLCLKFSGKGLP